jgi:hypothetical protein
MTATESKAAGSKVRTTAAAATARISKGNQ